MLVCGIPCLWTKCQHWKWQANTSRHWSSSARNAVSTNVDLLLQTWTLIALEEIVHLYRATPKWDNTNMIGRRTSHQSFCQPNQKVMCLSPSFKIVTQHCKESSLVERPPTSSTFTNVGKRLCSGTMYKPHPSKPWSQCAECIVSLTCA
jgi:hypothetical protein